MGIKLIFSYEVRHIIIISFFLKLDGGKMKLFLLPILSMAICASAGTDDIAISLSLGLSDRISAIEARQSKILEAIAAATNQEKSRWDELKLEMKQLLKKEKVDQPVDQSANTQVTIQATE